MPISLPPSRFDMRLLLGCIALALLLAAAGHRIVELNAMLDAKPEVSERIITRTVQGPTRTEVRTIVKPGGERVEERIVYVESKVTERDREHSESPSAPKRRTRYLGIGVDPLDYARAPRIRAGATVFGSVDAGIAYDPRLAPTKGAVQLEISYRF